MGFSYRKRVGLGRNAWLNISKRGVSGSVRRGRVTMNTRGRTNIRIAKGLSYRGGCGLVLLAPIAAVMVVAAATHLL